MRAEDGISGLYEKSLGCVLDGCFFCWRMGE